MSFAISPFGAGSTAFGKAPPTVTAKRAAYIDPRTRDYVLDSEGERQRMPEVRQQFLLALTTLLASSSADQTKGILLPQKVTDDLQRQVRTAVVTACKHITDAGRAVITNVVAEVLQTGRVQITVSYDDLTIGERGNVVI